MLKARKDVHLTQKSHVSPAEYYKLNKRIRGIFTVQEKNELLKVYEENKKLASFSYHG